MSAVARSVLVVAEDPEAEGGDGGVLAHAKSSTARRGNSLRYVIDETRDGFGRFRWNGTSEFSADDLVRDQRHQRAEKRQSAEEWLADRLASGPVSSTTIQAEAERAGVTERTLWRAKKELGVDAIKNGATWVWQLPGNPVSGTGGGRDEK